LLLLHFSSALVFHVVLAAGDEVHKVDGAVVELDEREEFLFVGPLSAGVCFFVVVFPVRNF